MGPQSCLSFSPSLWTPRPSQAASSGLCSGLKESGGCHAHFKVGRAVLLPVSSMVVVLRTQGTFGSSEDSGDISGDSFGCHLPAGTAAVT